MMTNTRKLIRKSHCSECGRRLSLKAPTGEIRWQPSAVDDKGIYCAPFCRAKDGKGKKNGRA